MDILIELLVLFFQYYDLWSTLQQEEKFILVAIATFAVFKELFNYLKISIKVWREPRRLIVKFKISINRRNR